MSHFFALDVETANADMSSICQVGIVEFSESQVVNCWGTLIDPEDYFDPFNVTIHGITPKMVHGSACFPDIYSSIRQLTNSQVVVTHMLFDQTSLRRACQKYGLPEIACAWLDSARVARRQWEQIRRAGYNLPDLAEFLKITYRPHDAIEDARAAGEVIIKAMEQSGLSLEEWCDRAYKPISSTTAQSIVQDGDPDGPFYGETIAFTGALAMPRRVAAERAAKAGCSVSDGVTKETTILVVGIQNVDRLAGYEKSSKHRKAENLISRGQPIRIMTENDFLSMIGY